MGKEDPSATTTTKVDPRTQSYLDYYRDRAKLGVERGAPREFGEFTDYARQAAGNLGFGSQTGMGGISEYFNPYQDEVIAGVRGDFDRQRTGASQRAADVATRAGAFGGSRGEVLEAEMLRDVNQSEAGTLANVRMGGFSQAQQAMMAERARASQLGLAGMGGLFQGAQYLDQRQLASLQAMGGAMGPFQGTQTTTEEAGRDPFGSAMGGAMMGGAVGGPYGAAIGGGLGLLGGMFF